MSQAERAAVDGVDVLGAEERAWLTARLQDYRELLEYLRDH